MRNILLLSALLIFTCCDYRDSQCIYEAQLYTLEASDITDTSATLYGSVGIFSQYCGDVAPGEMMGFVYSTNPSPTNDDNIVLDYPPGGATGLSASIDNLVPDTTYYVRVFITNNFGEFYGNEVEFTTNEEFVPGCDGIIHPSIVYGTQEWTVENACHITYRDGTPIPEVTGNQQWGSLTTGAWCYYNNDNTKGILYNWYAVMGIYDEASLNNPSLRKEFAPEGWHVPSDAEWTTLENYLIINGYNYDGTTIGNKIAKAMASTTGWDVSSASQGAIGNVQSLNNSSGFNAFPVGIRGSGSGYNFYNEGRLAVFWSSDVINTSIIQFAFSRRLSFASQILFMDINQSRIGQGNSVRLVKD